MANTCLPLAKTNLAPHRVVPVLSMLLWLLAACRPSPSASAPLSPATSPPPTPTVTPKATAQERNFRGWIAFNGFWDGVNDLFLMNPETMEVRPLGTGPAFPAWSPDFTQIAFLAGSQKDRINVLQLGCIDRGDCPSSITTYPLDMSGRSTISWLPDAKSIMFTTDEGYPEEALRFAVLSLTTGDVSLILADAGPYLDVAPQGDRVLFNSEPAFVVFNMDPHLDQLMLLNLPTGIAAPLIGPTDQIPNSSDGEWSPDGGHIAFMTTFGEGMAYGIRYDVFVANADGTNPHLIAEDALNPDWSPDGASIVFEREDGLYVVNLSTGAERQVLALPTVHAPPMAAWSP